MKLLNQRSQLGLTLVEMLMSLGCGALILAAVVTAGVAMQRSYGAIEAYSTAEADQLRVLDYLAMDCRRATIGTLSGLTGNTPALDNGSWVNGSWVHDTTQPLTVILTLPVYYDSSNNYTAITPTLTSGTLSYGSGSITVTYQKSGNNFNRSVKIGTNVYTTAIAKNVSSFTVADSNLATSNGTISCSLMFFPTFLRNTGSGTWWSGQYSPDHAPDNSIGANGDWYVVSPNSTSVDQTLVGNVYFKSGGSYTLLQNVKATQLYCNTFLRNPNARQFQ